MATRQTRLNEPQLDESLVPFRMKAHSFSAGDRTTPGMRALSARSRAAFGSLQYSL